MVNEKQLLLDTILFQIYFSCIRTYGATKKTIDTLKLVVTLAFEAAHAPDGWCGPVSVTTLDKPDFLQPLYR